MNKKLIDLYKEWMEKGTMGKPRSIGGGLCNTVPDDYLPTLDMLRPKSARTFWGAAIDRNVGYKRLAYDFTPLRQTIVLLICAMHNEL